MKLFPFGLAVSLVLTLGCAAPAAMAQIDMLAIAKETDAKAENVRLIEDARGTALTFDDPQASKGSITIPLTALDKPLSQFDALHFDLLLEHGMVEPIVTLWGYPDASSSRRWFYKREANKRQAADDRRREAEHQRREAERDMRMQLMRTSGVPVFHRDTDLGELGADE